MTDKEKETQKEAGYYLHYIGTGLYSIKKFEEESTKYGVNRPIPKMLARKMKWGDPILLAQYRHKDDDAYKENTAEIFGYYTIDGVNIIASDNFKKILYLKLDIVSTYQLGGTVNRECGNYSISATHTITNTLEELIDRIIETEKQLGEKAKIFLAGRYIGLKNYVYLAPVKFTQGSFKVDLKEELWQEAVKEQKLGIIENYNQRLYVKKKDKKDG